MADQPYTLESADFTASINATVEKAKNDIASIDAEISVITEKFKADIQSRQARKADLTLISVHGSAIVEKIKNDSTNVLTAIEAGMKTALADVGKELNDFGDMLSGKKAPAPAITLRAPPEAVAVPPAAGGPPVDPAAGTITTT